MNPGFEDGLTDWMIVRDFNMSHSAKEAARLGNLGLRLTDEDPEKGSGLQSLPVAGEGGKTYELSFWMRLVSGAGRVTVQMRPFNEAMKATSKKQIKLNATPTSEWKRYSIKRKLPEEALQLAVRISSANKSVLTVDIDDVECREVIE
ncbi:MAG: carbohydrate binding domain-containing protein [Chthoniobacterales bacterium]